jgi:hypothetical protein
MTLALSEMKQESIYGPQFMLLECGLGCLDRACRNTREARFHNPEMLCKGIIKQKCFVKK